MPSEEELESGNRPDDVADLRGEISQLRAAVDSLTAQLTGVATLKHLRVSRLDVVEEDGIPRLTATSRSSSPATVVDGVTIPGRNRTGLLFFNDIGEECGGLIFGGGNDDSPGASFTFDRIRQDQTLQLIYQEYDGRYQTALKVNDQPSFGLSSLKESVEAAEAMEDGPAKRAAFAKLDESGAQSRVFVGRDYDGSAVLRLLDARSRPRLVLSVPAEGEPTIRVLDTEGNVEREL